MNTCDVCGEGKLRQTVGVKSVTYKGVTDRIRHIAQECDVCKVIIFDDESVRENRRAWLRFRKHVDGAPLGCEIRAMRLKHGLTQVEAGELFGGGPVAFSKYESDDLIPDAAMTNLLRLVIAYPQTLDQLRASRGGVATLVFLDYSPADELLPTVDERTHAAPNAGKRVRRHRSAFASSEGKYETSWKNETWTTQ